MNLFGLKIIDRLLKKRFFFITLLIIWPGFTMAQQKPQYTQYVFNNYLINPAYTGVENYIDVKAGHRNQWTGLEGAPKTTYLTVNAPIGSDFLNGGHGSGNPNQRLFTQNYMAAEPHHGVGLMLVSDKAGYISQTNIAASYAYHIGLNYNTNLAVGVTAGVGQYSINTSQITLENAMDPAINNGSNSKWNPDVSVGVLAYGANYFIGASVQQLLKQSFIQTNYNNQSKTVPHFLFSAGIRLPLTDELSLMPSTLVKFIQPLPVTFDANLKLAFMDTFWVGASYRKNDSFGGMAGFNINSFINVGYSYDMTTSNLNLVSRGTHEIVLGLMLNNTYKVKCPSHSF